MKKKSFIVAMILVCLVSLTGCTKKENNNKLTIIATSFPGYDFARAITKESEKVEVKLLLKPGTEMHDFEPTPKDIMNIEKSDIFIYVGGDSDEWVEELLKKIDKKKTKIIKLMDLVENTEEEIIEGMEEEKEEDEEEVEYDEHVWTSPKNAIKIVQSLQKNIISIDKDNKKLYEENSKSYIERISKIDKEIEKIVENSKRKMIVFGDRFPIRYFTDQYNLDYYAAFPGCSEQTEASAKTISFLIEKVKENNIPVIFHIELSNGKIAKTISDETGAKVLEFHTAHNISQEDFDKGVTYADIMKENEKVLKKALN